MHALTGLVSSIQFHVNGKLFLESICLSGAYVIMYIENKLAREEAIFVHVTFSKRHSLLLIWEY